MPTLSNRQIQKIKNNVSSGRAHRPQNERVHRGSFQIQQILIDHCKFYRSHCTCTTSSLQHSPPEQQSAAHTNTMHVPHSIPMPPFPPSAAATSLLRASSESTLVGRLSRLRIFGISWHSNARLLPHWLHRATVDTSYVGRGAEWPALCTATCVPGATGAAGKSLAYTSSLWNGNGVPPSSYLVNSNNKIFICGLFRPIQSTCLMHCVPSSATLDANR